MTIQLLHGDCRDVLKALPDNSVHACITSPPYWGLRSYLPDGHPMKAREIGSEPTVHDWVATMVEVFREVRRVLRPDGTLWLNLGDSYATRWSSARREGRAGLADNERERHGPPPDGFKNKDLIGQPWRVAFALQADGWWLRQELIWAKKNPMPESVTDRFTKAHEQVFLFSKGRWTGVAEPIACSDVDAAWLAALIDGEGTIGIGGTSNGHFQGHIHVANTNRALLEKAAAVTGHGSITSSGKGVNWPVYRWQVSGPKAASILYRIRHFLIAKQRQADNLLEFQETVRRYGGAKKPDEVLALQRDLWLRGKALNKGGDITIAANRARWDGGTYYFDLESVKEPASEGTHARYAQNGGKAPQGAAWGVGDQPRDAAALSAHKQATGYQKGQGVGRIGGHPDNPPEGARRKLAEAGSGTKNNGSFDKAMAVMPATRNPRTVRWLASEPFRGAHYATYPAELIRPFVLAGCPEGGVVLDPFGGSGTTGLVADQHGRSAILIDIDERNLPMARERIAADAPLFTEVAA